MNINNKQKNIYSIFIKYQITGIYESKYNKKLNQELTKYIKDKFSDSEFTYSTTYLIKAIISGNQLSVLGEITKFFDDIYKNLGNEYKDCVKITVATYDDNSEKDTNKKSIEENFNIMKDINEAINNLKEENNQEVYLNNKTEEKEEIIDKEKELILNKLNALEGVEEFKNYIKELLEMSNSFKELSKSNIFDNLAVVFSINDGYGLSTALDILNQTLIYCKLIDSTSQIPKEMVITPSTDKENQLDTFANQLYNASKGLLCIDISNHIDRVYTNSFRNLLRKLSKLMLKKYIVFRIPYLEKEVLSHVSKAINDIMFAKTISFTPFTKEQTENIAKKTLKKYNISFSEDGLDIFNKKIVEEKNDGRYYGIRTINKVVSEILYTKILAINKDKYNNEKIISKDDIEEILTFKETDNLTGLEELDTLIGMEDVKEKVIEITNQIKATIKYQMKTKQSIHMRFVGSPGTGKTTIARIIGKILKENNVLRIGSFYEVSGRDLVGKYIGHTAPKTTEICRDAYGSVLFIDEAYTLYRNADNGKDFGLEAIDTLIAQLENHRDDMVVIFAGYEDEMDLLMQSNPGLSSRVPYEIKFNNYSKDSLYQIFVRMVEKNELDYEENYLKEAENFFKQLPDAFINAKSFGNARFVRNIFERSLSKAITRCEITKQKIVLTSEDFVNAKNEDDFKVLNEKKKIRLGYI